MANTSRQAPHPLKSLIKLWAALNGDTAYAAYLEHHRRHHTTDTQPPLSRKAFFAAETRRKWQGVKRCC